MIIVIKSLIGLVLVLAYLGFAFTIAFVFGRAAASANDVHPYPKGLVTAPGAISADLPASVSPYEEVFYAHVDRFDDPEGDL
jgi:hypothetical protein